MNTSCHVFELTCAHESKPPVVDHDDAASARIETAPVLQHAGSAEVPPGWKECLLPIESIEHGARTLLGYGAHVRILGPQALKDQFIDALSQVKAFYQAGAIEARASIAGPPLRNALPRCGLAKNAHDGSCKSIHLPPTFRPAA
ncbi:WYL domain-containing protein [Burkholderia cepacia]|uniref:WYL domain-containing protein n=1 Tax=Burkholderia cepacia TaxID=292 RepID=UPI0022AADCD8|nr:WYL domain-containing protein [Burkholderia cepacia]